MVGKSLSDGHGSSAGIGFVFHDANDRLYNTFGYLQQVDAELAAANIRAALAGAAEVMRALG
jgi:hypothetical protein